MIGGKGYNVDKYALSGLTEDDIFWMEVIPYKSNGQNYNYFWRFLIKEVKFEDENITIMSPKYVILNSRI